MTAAEIAAALGGVHRSGAWWRCRCPVHGSRGATLALRDGDRRLIAHCHAGCDRRDVMAELRQRGLVADRTYSVAPSPVRYTDDRTEAARRIALARHLWNTAQDARGSPVVRYLACRGICTASLPSLRWAPALRRPDGTNGPAMVARVDGIDGELIGIARTWLDRDAAGKWRRRDRVMLGRTASGAVRLAEPDETLLVGEGVETCLAAMQACRLPAWAALSTSGIIALALPPIVRNVIILADHDANGAGERTARAAAGRWLAEGRRVRIAMPPEPSTDFNDVLLGRAHARIMEARDVAS